ncbi:MAG TPA: TAXI family TRAP transporter solute-binding subunit [Burkholderiales bacterium]|nr:TAXI family TRAP transporter solute-binding subunit [Burkholderiales bacterium]
MAASKRRLDRDLLFVAIPATLVVVGALGVTLLLMRPAPPSEIVMSTGAAEGSYHDYAMKYRDILARDGVTLRLWPSGGAMENLHRLSDPSAHVDVALVQGGMVSAVPPESSQGLVSLGSVCNEVLWVFYRGDRTLDRLPPLGGKMIAIGAENSGTAALAMALLEATGIAKPPTTIMKIGGRAAESLLLSGGIDAAFFVASPHSPIVQELLRAKNVHLLSFSRADAYTRRYFYLNKFILPQGAFDLVQNIPERDVVLIGTTVNLVVKDDLHPALAYLLLRAASEVHNAPTLFSGLREFPAPNDTELPLSPEAARFYKSGPPLLQRYLPFWGANLVDRLLVLVLPALVVLIPAARLLPLLYRWRVRSRIYRWYALLKEIELELEERRTPAELDDILERLEKLDGSIHRIETPLAYSENLYAFRQHIDLVRQRAQFAIQRAERNAIAELQPLRKPETQGGFSALP